jgi:hypothetical protein
MMASGQTSDIKRRQCGSESTANFHEARTFTSASMFNSVNVLSRMIRTPELAIANSDSRQLACAHTHTHAHAHAHTHTHAHTVYTHAHVDGALSVPLQCVLKSYSLFDKFRKNLLVMQASESKIFCANNRASPSIPRIPGPCHHCLSDIS